MFSRARIVTLVLAAGIVMLGVGAAEAQTLTGNFQVQANVAKSCTMSTATLDFVSYDSFTQAQVDGTANLTMRCTRATTAAISLSNGAHATAGGARRMAVSASEFLSYELYSDASRTQRWGSTGTEIFSWLAATSAATPVPIYGRIPASQDAVAGAYTDTINVTVNY